MWRISVTFLCKLIVVCYWFFHCIIQFAVSVAHWTINWLRGNGIICKQFYILVVDLVLSKTQGWLLNLWCVKSFDAPNLVLKLTFHFHIHLYITSIYISIFLFLIYKCKVHVGHKHNSIKTDMRKEYFNK